MDLAKHSEVKSSEVKECKYCGKEFVKKHQNHLFCSKNCARENYKTHHSTYQPKNEIFNKTCQFCEEKFETKIFNKIYCSDDCGKQYRQMKYMQSRKLKGLKLGNRKCLNCEKEFVFDLRKQSGKKYCNDKCGYEYNLKKRRKRKNSADNLKEIVTNKVKKILEQAKNTEPNTALGITISEFVLTSFTEKVKEEILERDGHKCYVCESEYEELEIHHILKRRLGGSNEPKNLITLCVKCHRAIETSNEEHALRVCYKKAKQVINGHKEEGLTNTEKINSLRFVLESTFDAISGEEEFDKDELLLKINEVLIQTE